MTKHISSIFAPIYEKWALDNKQELQKEEKIVDAIYHEREFGVWLKNEFGNENQKINYPSLVNSKNFEKYLKAYGKRKNKQEEKLKKENILEGLKVENIGVLSKQPYDIDMVSNYFKIKEALEKLKKPKPGIVNDFFLESALSPIQYFCEEKNWPLNTILEGKYPIVVDANAHNYEIHLARTLMTYDLNKVNALLDYQNAAWQKSRTDFFPSIVEHGTYNYLVKNSPFNNETCLKKIMRWVEKNRVFVPNIIIEKAEESNYFYWPFAEEKLKKLELKLIENNCIQKTSTFYSSFKISKDFPKPSIIWLGSHVQLMSLLYLIYKKKGFHKNMPIHQIGVYLFKPKTGDYTVKTLNTSLNEIRPKFEKSGKRSPALQIILDIVLDLNLL